MTRILLFIKHNLPFVWLFVEWLNTLLFRWLHGDKLQQRAQACFQEFTLDGVQFRMVQPDDLVRLHDLLHRQEPTRLEYFRPHPFGMNDLKKANRNPAFLMFGAFQEDIMVGYFFLRCFWNRKCFVGRLIDQPFERQGIGRVMNQIMYHTAWRSGFRCFTTVSRNNALVMRSHANNPTARVLKELAGNFLLVEFVSNNSLSSPDQATNVATYLSKTVDGEST